MTAARRIPEPCIVSWPLRPIADDDWRVRLAAADLDEIRDLAGLLARNPLPTFYLRPDFYALPRCRALAGRIRSCLAGVGFALVDRLPVDELDDAIATQVYWLLSCLVGRPVAQKLDGTLLYHVEDKGRPPSPGSGVRPADTNYEQLPHTDNAFNATAPESVGLLCLRAAKQGGVSRCLSFPAIHARLAAERPDLLDRLYRPFPHDRQREFWPGEAEIIEHPVFSAVDGRLIVRFSPHQIRNACAMRGTAIDEAGGQAIERMSQLCSDPAMWVEFTMTAGQIQYVNNHQAGHARSSFEDHAEPDRRRHMVRIWLRDAGRPDYAGH